ncbi:hypothetical protein J2W49_001514 [Hydrogenophaga palleronii]|uniref:Uncharacterized protein n=1 Tax=Hydrogenophaga palleronii TaxID=65655 RepID=A0ABU1WJU1_9BURK|nr:hypothetical protein [Hydrogenophaga palleronii]MDR7149565.1 hypothetical protein [Hydrogenophaga palleronii]
MIQVKYPEMRKELEEHLQALADPAYQRRAWVDGQAEGAVQHDKFDYAVHFLYDDTQLASDAHSTVGWILNDAAEADCVTALVSSIEVVFERYGTKLSDAEYIDLPEWHSVVLAAKTAAASLMRR